MNIQPIEDAIQHYQAGMITALEFWNKIGNWHVSQNAGTLRALHDEALATEDELNANPPPATYA